MKCLEDMMKCPCHAGRKEEKSEFLIGNLFFSAQNAKG